MGIGADCFVFLLTFIRKLKKRDAIDIFSR